MQHKGQAFSLGRCTRVALAVALPKKDLEDRNDLRLFFGVMTCSRKGSEDKDDLRLWRDDLSSQRTNRRGLPSSIQELMGHVARL